MRNGIYTYYQGFHLNVTTIRDDDNRVMLHCKDEIGSSFKFISSGFENGAHYFIVGRKELCNAYFVKTFGIFKGIVFQLFDVNYTTDKIVRIGTGDRGDFISATGLNEPNKDWYIYDIKVFELTEIWEERTPALNLAMPDGLKEKEIIKF